MAINLITNTTPPYEYEDVTAILIEGMSDFTFIVKGSLRDTVALINGVEQLTITAIDQFDGSKIFVFAQRIAAVKYEPENLTVLEGGVGKLTRPLP